MSFLNPFARSQKARGGPSSAQAPPTAQPGTPLELISYDTQSGKFFLGEDALEVLRKVKGPVGVVAVSGRARQGKSFILNQLLGQSTGFVVAPTHRPCTKGLWMWSSPVERHSADGSKYHLVLLDTEGIDAYDQTGQYSTQIFSLAVLLSSLFVYNQMGGIDEAALDRLSLVTEMTKHVRVRAGSSAGEGEAELSDFTPAFLWLLRDFYLTLEEDGRQLTPREYLETALRSVEGSGPAVEAKNQIRESIKALFPNRDCFSLVRPMNDEKQLARMDALAPSSLRPEFVEGIARLTRLIFMRAQPKRLGNQIVSGAMLAALAEAYVAAINNGAVPTIATAWQGVAEAECRRGADAAEASYHEAFKDSTGMDDADLDAEHQRCMGIARRVFAGIAVGEESVRKANEARFSERLESSFQQLRQQRLASAESESRKMIGDITTRLTQLANRQDTTLEGLQEELAAWETAYRSSKAAAGPAKWRLHAEFIQDTYSSIVRGLVQRKEQATQAELAAAAQRATDVEHRLHQAEARAADLERQLLAARQEAKQQHGAGQQSAARIATLEQQLQAVNAEKDRALREGTEKVKTAEGGYAKHTARLEQQLQQALQQTAALQSSKNSAEARLDEMKRQVEAARKEAEQAKLQAGNAHVQEQALQQAQREMVTLKDQLDLTKRQLEEATAAQAQTAAHAAALQQQLDARLAEQPHAAMQGPEDMDEGYGTPDEDATAHVTPSKMTIKAMKDWLTERGHENVAWELTQAKAKKPDYVKAMNDVLGR